MHDALTGLRTGRGDSRAANHVVEPALTENEQLLARVANGARGFVEQAAQLSLAQSVEVFDLLLFGHGEAVVRLLLTAHMHTGRRVAAFQRAASAAVLEDQQTQATIDSALGPNVVRHCNCIPTGKRKEDYKPVRSGMRPEISPPVETT